METREQCMCMCIYVCFYILICFSIYLFVHFILSIYVYVFLKSMHVYLHINMCCNTGNGQLFLGAKPAQNGGKQTLFLSFFKAELHWIKNVQNQNAQDGKSTIVKTKVDHIICKLHCCGKNGFHEKSQNTLEFMGAPGASCAFMGAHWCSCVFVWLFGFLVVCLFDCLIIFKTPPFFWSWKNGIEMEVPEWLFSFGRDG